MEATKTYGEKVEQMKATIQQLYADSEWMRDAALGKEKKYWNEFRGIFFDAEKPLRQMLDNMEESEFKREL
jgi:hypothetical protein